MTLSVENISFAYNSKPILKDICFQAEPGEIVGVLGVNGAGKSTLLKMLNRILKPKKGSITLDKKDVLGLRRREIAKKMAYVPQHSTHENLTVFDTALLGRRPHITWAPRRKDMLIVEDTLRVMGLEDYALRPVNTLSGGEIQKVVIARALAQEPQVLLLDEPTSNLDLRNQLELMSLLRVAVDQRNCSAILVVHDLNLALRYSDKCLAISNGLGRLYKDKNSITPQEIRDIYGVNVVIKEVEGRPVVVPLNCCQTTITGDTHEH